MSIASPTNFHLISTVSAVENVVTGLLSTGTDRAEREVRAVSTLHPVALLDCYIITTATDTRVFWNWMHCVTSTQIARELTAAEFRAPSSSATWRVLLATKPRGRSPCSPSAHD